jgi:hypothetical protein
MGDKGHMQTDWGRPVNDPLDQELEAALAKYASVEPPAGLEERVLADLRTILIPARPWWRWSMAAALAAILVTAALGWRLGKHSPAITTDRASTVIHRLNEPAPEVVTHNVRNKEPMRAQPEGQRSAGHEVHSHVATAGQPKLDQFPSPQPLSEQEKILESYVAKYPERAVLLARLRTEQLRQDQLEEMKDLSSDGTGQNSKTEE